MLFALWQIEISRAEGLLHSKGEAHLPGIPVDMPGLIREGAVEFWQHKPCGDRGGQPFQRPRIQLPNDGYGVEQTGIAWHRRKR